MPLKAVDQTSSSSDSEPEMEFDDESDETLEDMDIIEGDFVVVKIAWKSRVVHYIARVDLVHDYEYEGIFLRSFWSCGFWRENMYTKYKWWGILPKRWCCP